MQARVRSATARRALGSVPAHRLRRQLAVTSSSVSSASSQVLPLGSADSSDPLPSSYLHNTVPSRYSAADSTRTAGPNRRTNIPGESRSARTLLMGSTELAELMACKTHSLRFSKGVKLWVARERGLGRFPNPTSCKRTSARVAFRTDRHARFSAYGRLVNGSSACKSSRGCNTNRRTKGGIFTLPVTVATS